MKQVFAETQKKKRKKRSEMSCLLFLLSFAPECQLHAHAVSHIWTRHARWFLLVTGARAVSDMYSGSVCGSDLAQGLCAVGNMSSTPLSSFHFGSRVKCA